MHFLYYKRATCGLIAMFLAPALSGCSVWEGARYEAETTERIDSRLAEGMTLGEFESLFPDARITSDDGSRRVYLVGERSVCFICTTRTGFRRSRDVFARAVHFESGRLVAIDPVSEWSR